MENVKEIFGERVRFASDQYEPLENADGLIVCTEWSVFRSPDYDRIKTMMKNNLVFDGRNVFEPSSMKERGFDYYSIGRP